MPLDRSNDRRDKALENIARHLGDISGLLNKIEKNGRPEVTNVSVRPDAFDVPQEPQPDAMQDKVNEGIAESGKDEKRAVFPASNHPYFKQRSPLDGSNGPYPNRDFPLGA